MRNNLSTRAKKSKLNRNNSVKCSISAESLNKGVKECLREYKFNMLEKDEFSFLFQHPEKFVQGHAFFMIRRNGL